MPYTTLASGLTIKVPTRGTRNWATTFLDDFAKKISSHDHTGSPKGLKIASGALASNAVTSDKIADSAVTTAKIANSAVTTAKIADANVTLAKLASDAIGGFLPTGSVLPYTGASAPTGFLLCNGAAVSRTDYAALFTVIQETQGAGDGFSTFNLPDLRQRFPLGKADSGTGSTLGATGGEIDHDHTVKGHYHGMGTGADLNITASGDHSHTATNGQGILTSDGTIGVANGVSQFNTTARITNTSSATHVHPSGNIAGRIGLVTGGENGNADMNSGTNNPPFLALNYIIKT